MTNLSLYPGRAAANWLGLLIALILTLAATAARGAGTPAPPMVVAAPGVGTSVPQFSAPGLRLMMFEQRGCIYCAHWNAKIGPIYPKTSEGAAAPLMRHDLADPMPPGLRLQRPVRLTPTFVLLRDGVELARIEGYPGEDFFWGLLDRMLKEAATPTGKARL